ncbi:unnamed protein product [Absidia cylindrospora]
MAPNTSQRPLYIRVKREKTITFLCIELQDTILSIKEKLIPIMAKSKPVEDIRLYLDTTPAAASDTPQQQTVSGRLLEDHQTAKASGLGNDVLVYLIYFDHDHGKWEEINVVEFESLDDDADEAMEMTDDTPKKKEKGKGRA